MSQRLLTVSSKGLPRNVTVKLQRANQGINQYPWDTEVLGSDETILTLPPPQCCIYKREVARDCEKYSFLQMHSCAHVCMWTSFSLWQSCRIRHYNHPILQMKKLFWGWWGVSPRLSWHAGSKNLLIIWTRMSNSIGGSGPLHCLAFFNLHSGDCFVNLWYYMCVIPDVIVSD